MKNIGKLVATATLDIAPFQTNTKQLKTYMRGIDSSLKAVENLLAVKGVKSKVCVPSIMKQDKLSKAISHY